MQTLFQRAVELQTGCRKCRHCEYSKVLPGSTIARPVGSPVKQSVKPPERARPFVVVNEAELPKTASPTLTLLSSSP
jgi:hypothetical protein